MSTVKLGEDAEVDRLATVVASGLRICERAFVREEGETDDMHSKVEYYGWGIHKKYEQITFAFRRSCLADVERYREI